ncbi:hypothetical protein DLREEDagrD3_29120 [Denitratisoma sp. agr-D3]
MIIEEIQKAGANARAMGASLLDNPYYKSEAMPAATGESIQDWQAKAKNWEFGWEMEGMAQGIG